jgi:hypothetical protein
LDKFLIILLYALLLHSSYSLLWIFNSCSILLAIFPGYYTGRALHVHVKVFPDWHVLPNNSFRGGKLAHVGQFFFDDDLEAVIDEVRLLYNFPVEMAGWIVIAS